jgi:hypothetical protein
VLLNVEVHLRISRFRTLDRFPFCCRSDDHRKRPGKAENKQSDSSTVAEEASEDIHILGFCFWGQLSPLEHFNKYTISHNNVNKKIALDEKFFLTLRIFVKTIVKKSLNSNRRLCMSDLIRPITERLIHTYTEPLKTKYHIHDFSLPMTPTVERLLTAELIQIACLQIANEYANERRKLICAYLPGKEPTDFNAWIGNMAIIGATTPSNNKVSEIAKTIYVRDMGRVWANAGAKANLESYYHHTLNVRTRMKQAYDSLPPMETRVKGEGESYVMVEESMEIVRVVDGKETRSRTRQWDFKPETEAGEFKTVLNPEHEEAVAELDAEKNRLLNEFNLGLISSSPQLIVQACLMPIAPYGACLWPKSEFIFAAGVQAGGVLELLDWDFKFQDGQIGLRRWADRLFGKALENLDMVQLAQLRARILEGRLAA